MLHEVHSKVLFLNEYPSFIVFDFEFLHKLIFLNGNLLYDLYNVLKLS